MIGNLLNILIGLWLAYSVIRADPAGAINNLALAIAAVVVVFLATWARRTDYMKWPSATNIVLGVTFLLAAASRWAVGMAPLVSFWLILLAGITLAIVAMWSLLYRPETPDPRAMA